MSTIKGLTPAKDQHDGSSLRIAIVHGRWNIKVVKALVAGAVSKLKERGVKESNIVIESVPGSYELPLACSKIIAGSHVPSTSSLQDLLGGLNFAGTATPPVISRSATPSLGGASQVPMPNRPFDAVIAIGVLIKGATMHFEYISESVVQGLMRVQLDTGVPVIFGILTALTDEQALERAGLGSGVNNGHNHGEDWGLAAVEMATHFRRWGEGRFSS